MSLPRMQLLEFNDETWVPDAIRESLIESLSRALDWGRMLRGLVAPFAKFLEETQAREVLDLCSGAGGPVVVLATELKRAGKAVPRFLLTDILPHARALGRAGEGASGRDRIRARAGRRDEHPGRAGRGVARV